jgi:hypothetical protein
MCSKYISVKSINKKPKKKKEKEKKWLEGWTNGQGTCHHRPEDLN